jgi:RNA polymerase-binding transcription factor DksA
MNTSELERRVREKERELLADMTRTEAEARDSRAAEVNDAVVSSESKEISFRETSFDWNEFAQVREALGRIEAGNYGKCVDCGRQIEQKRLKSIPWTPYCIKDQRRRDLQTATAGL